MGKWYLSTRLVALVAVMALSTGVLGATAAFPQPTSEAAVADQAAGGAANAPTAQLTPLVVSTFARPHPVLGTDNRIHLAYELQLTNIAATTLTIDRVQVLDPSRDARVVDELSGEELASRLIVFGSSPTSPPTKQFGPGVGGFLFMDVTYRKGERLPDRLKYRFTVSTSEDAGSDNSFPAGPTLVAQDDPVVVGAPLSGKRWLAGEGCCETITSHRGAIFPINGTFHSPERFAIDWVQVGTNGKLWKGPRDELSSYPYYGAKVRSVADGRVVATRDDLEEQTPGTSPTDLALEEYGATTSRSTSATVATRSTPTCRRGTRASWSSAATGYAKDRSSASWATPATPTPHICTSTSWTGRRSFCPTACPSRSTRSEPWADSPTTTPSRKAHPPRSRRSSQASTAVSCRSTAP